MTGIYVSSSCFIVIMLAILITRIWGYIEWNQSKWYAIAFVGMVGVYIMLDALFVRCFLMEGGSVTGFRAVVFLFYLVYVILPYMWHLFMQSYMGIRRRKGIQILEAIPVAVLLILVVVSAFTGIVWKITPAHEYVRGPLFSLFSVLNLFYYFFAVIQTICILLTRTSGKINYLLKSAIFSAIPLIGILVNTYVIPLYGVYPFQPYCLAIGALLVYLFMVEHQKNQVELEHRARLSNALEQEKEASRKAREAGAVKNTFLANMSHDIRTPMNAILGFSDMIARHPEDETIVRNAVAKIQASGDILLKIINDVLDLSKLDSGRIHLEETPVDLEQMAQKMETMLEYSMEKGGIAFEIINTMEHPCVWCDATKLQQVLVNILNNAVKFTPAGGKIQLKYEETPADLPEEKDSKGDGTEGADIKETEIEENEKQSVACTTENAGHGMAEYRITVKDTGIGMDEEFQKHAFEAFERERTSTESRTEGTGLGLAIVKRLVDIMGGQVTIKSKVGQGTEISITLSLRLASREQITSQGADAQALTADLSGMRVLLVEDNELNAEIVSEILSEHGLVVERAADGSAAIEKIEGAADGYYQLILMDIQMPKMNGYEATQKIRRFANKKKAKIPILAMTANAFEEDRKQALAAGMNGFITKPVDTDKLLLAIQETIGF